MAFCISRWQFWSCLCTFFRNKWRLLAQMINQGIVNCVWTNFGKLELECSIEICGYFQFEEEHRSAMRMLKIHKEWCKIMHSAEKDCANAQRRFLVVCETCVSIIHILNWLLWSLPILTEVDGPNGGLRFIISSWYVCAGGFKDKTIEIYCDTLRVTSQQCPSRPSWQRMLSHLTLLSRDRASLPAYVRQLFIGVSGWLPTGASVSQDPTSRQ